MYKNVDIFAIFIYSLISIIYRFSIIFNLIIENYVKNKNRYINRSSF